MVVAGNGKLLILILSPFAPTTSGASKIIDIIAVGKDGTTFGVWQGEEVFKQYVRDILIN